MRERCKPNFKQAYRYHDRGILVCDRWRTFDNFLADMGVRPAGTQLDRIDNDRGYDPANCRWATPSQNCRNTRRNRLITHNGITKTLAEWAELTGINYFTLASRLESPRLNDIFRGGRPTQCATQSE